MYRIRFHGRGGQGMKTASRILGTAFFLEGFEVQDAPRYGAERRGAPIFAYVRASHQTIHERGIIGQPDLVIVADESLVSVPAAGVLHGIDPHTVLLIHSSHPAQTWKERLNVTGPILILPPVDQAEQDTDLPHVGPVCAGAAARLVGVINPDALLRAIDQELASFEPTVVARNRKEAKWAYNLMAEHAGVVAEGQKVGAESYERPEWIDLPFENARVSAPTIHAAATSEQAKTGLWRTVRPIIDYDRCRNCWWICSTLCPDGAIHVTEEGVPQIDYEHCKGCMVCAAVCPSHAIEAVPEQEFQRQPQSGDRA